MHLPAWSRVFFTNLNLKNLGSVFGVHTDSTLGKSVWVEHCSTIHNHKTLKGMEVQLSMSKNTQQCCNWHNCFFYQLFDSHKANFGPLMRMQPHLPEIDQNAIYSLFRRPPGVLQQFRSQSLTKFGFESPISGIWTKTIPILSVRY